MTISNVKPGGWVIGENFTAAQATALDNQTTYALDKRSGQTDQLDSSIDVRGYVGFGPTSTLEVEGAAEVSVILGNPTGVVQVRDGGKIDVKTDGYLNIDAGVQTVKNSGKIKVNTAGGIELNGAGALVSQFDGSIKLGSGDDWIAYDSPYRSFQHHFGFGGTGKFYSGANGWSSSNGQYMVASDLGTTFVCDLPIPDFANGATLAGLTVWYQTNNVHSPLNPAKVEVFMVDPTTCTATSMCGSGPESLVYLTSSPQNITATTNIGSTIDLERYRYFLRLTEESGTSAVAGDTQVWSFSFEIFNLTHMRTH